MRNPLDVEMWRSRAPAARRPSAVLAKPPAYVAPGSAYVNGYTYGGSGTSRETQLRAYGMNGTLHQIVSRTAFTTSTACWDLWRSAASGREEDREAVTSHAMLDVWRAPNRFFTGQEFRETLAQHFELTGEMWYVIARPPGINLPLELWPVRPDRMYPVPSRDDYLVGYVYCDPDGTKVPLALDEVIYSRQPCPWDSYRGMSPISAILLDLDQSRLAREWNRNFFYNSAEPGGIIELEDGLSDPEFEEMRMRWAEQHRGVSAAHRVAILERGKWVDRKYTMRDMEFSKLTQEIREEIRRAYGYPKPMLGDVDDVNRANADAAETVFARWIVDQRLVRWRDMLNVRYVPLFGRPAKGLEWDYRNPVPEDQEMVNATRDSKMNAARTLYVDMHASRESIVEALELPATLVFEEPPAPPAPADAPAIGGPPRNVLAVRELIADIAPGWYADVDPLAALCARAERAMPLVLDGTLVNEAEDAEAVDLDEMQRDWQRELDALLAQWEGVTVLQRARIRRQVNAAVAAQDPQALAEIEVPEDDNGAAILALALAAMAAFGAAAVVREAAAQGVTLPAISFGGGGTAPADEPAREGDEDERRRRDHDPLPELASAMATVLGGSLGIAASREALRLYQDGADPETIANFVDQHLAGLSDAYLVENLGGLLTRAQNFGRTEQLRASPEATYYASETLDKNTCRPCRDIHGTRLPTLDAAMLAYGGAGYLFCEGRWRCRGTVVAVWE